MPLYSFRCTKCSHSFEAALKISDRDNTTSLTCSECSTSGDIVGNIVREVTSAMVAYSIVVGNGYGNKVPDGFKDVLKKIDERSPGSRMKETSAYLK